MKTTIYYFSGSGNSFVVAKDLAEKTNGNLISISQVMDNKTIKPDADVIGIVFPVYYIEHGGIPLIIGRFVKKLENLNTKYIFAVCTFGGGSLYTLDNLGKLIASRGGKLAAGFGVHMPQNSFHKPFENPKKLTDTWKKKLEVISECVNSQKPCNYDDLRNIVLKLILTPLIPWLKRLTEAKFKKISNLSLDLPFNELIPLIDRGFHTDEKCNGCGICSRICPVGNIEIVNQKPVWQNHCETCLACFHWCPDEAIHRGASEFRYHHPDVTLKDMILR